MLDDHAERLHRDFPGAPPLIFHMVLCISRARSVALAGKYGKYADTQPRATRAAWLHSACRSIGEAAAIKYADALDGYGSIKELSKIQPDAWPAAAEIITQEHREETIRAAVTALNPLAPERDGPQLEGKRIRVRLQSRWRDAEVITHNSLDGLHTIKLLTDDNGADISYLGIRDAIEDFVASVDENTAAVFAFMGAPTLPRSVRLAAPLQGGRRL